MTWDDVLAMGLKLPNVEAATSYGTPALKVRGKLVTRLRAEDDSLVLHSMPADEREMLIAVNPQVFHVTTHYLGHPTVLARLAALEPEGLWPFLIRRWREVAPKRAVISFDAAQAKS
ncbi:MmcQ/YjbR family DNA-binding protein [Methylobacterium sp. E-066]|uniref:MmcQ/YjbR family DNA-binding protein n=1 Tax=Methylobacterium sp. E-066 TaxID=2836584 RepID=UPI001FBB12D6|nr:MmcQ/YjbR family DNA-binding protein [Methylobacterium sp. E-066]MCJ2139983.1 MmcQ/YjbR family DNA-binding protein [Methylobacterium sp. E-066]